MTSTTTIILVPEILDPPHVDRPNYPTIPLIRESQLKDSIYKCIIYYLQQPLNIRNGQKLLEKEINEKRQSMTDRELFRQRQDGQGEGVKQSLLKHSVHRRNKQEEFILQLFHANNMHLTINVQDMITLLRPLTLDPITNCLYLCRRPDIPCALSMTNDPSIYILHSTKEENMNSDGGECCTISKNDLLRRKLVLVCDLRSFTIAYYCCRCCCIDTTFLFSLLFLICSHRYQKR